MTMRDHTPPPGGLYLIWLSNEDEPHYYGGRTTCYARRWRQHEVALQGATSNTEGTVFRRGVECPMSEEHQCLT